MAKMALWREDPRENELPLGSKLPMSVLGPCKTCGCCLGSSFSTNQAACSGGRKGL